jgi:hypothetical protein
MTDTITSQNIDFYSWITLYTNKKIIQQYCNWHARQLHTFQSWLCTPVHQCLSNKHNCYYKQGHIMSPQKKKKKTSEGGCLIRKKRSRLCIDAKKAPQWTFIFCEKAWQNLLLHWHSFIKDHAWVVDVKENKGKMMIMIILLLLIIMQLQVSHTSSACKNFTCTHSPGFTPFCFTPLCLKFPCRLPPLLNLHSFIFSLTSFAWLLSITPA